MSDPIKMIDWIADRVVPLNKAKKMEPEELEGKILTGVFHNVTDRLEYTDAYAQMMERVQAKKAK